MKLEITLDQLKDLLTQQKKITADNLRQRTTYYNPKSTASSMFSIDLDEQKFIEVALSSRFPEEIRILEKYLPNDKL